MNITRPRTSQPRGPARIDWSNASTKDLQFLKTFANFDAVSGKLMPKNSSNPPTSIAQGMVGQGGDGAGSYGPLIRPLPTSNDRAFLVVFSYTTKGAFQSCRPHAFGTQAGAGFSANYFLNGGNVNTDINGFAQSSLGPDKPVNVICGMISDASLIISLNGGTALATTGTGQTFSGAQSYFVGCNLSGSGAMAAGTVIFLSAVWARAIYGAEALSLIRNPWQLLLPESRMVWPSVASAPTFLPAWASQRSGVIGAGRI